MADAYVQFEEAPTISTKTSRWFVRSTTSGALLGTIGWFSRWRQYTFHPEAETVYNPECLRAIALFVETKTKEHRERARAR